MGNGRTQTERRGAAIDLAVEFAGTRAEKIQERTGFDFVGQKRGVFGRFQTIGQVEGENNAGWQKSVKG